MINKITGGFLFLLTVSAVCCNNREQKLPVTKARADNVFAHIEYDKVIAYNYNGGDDIAIIDEKGRLAKNIKEQVELNKAQTDRLTNLLCDRATYGADMAACFDPHFGIVFYKMNKPAAYVSICLDCNYLISSIKIPGAEGGFSSKGITGIVDFEKELNFLH